MPFLKTALLNALIFLSLLLLIEGGLRAIWTAKECVSPHGCDFTKLTSLSIAPPGNDFTKQNRGLSKYDGTLGYIPTPGFDHHIRSRGWENIKVTIQQDGFRSNDNHTSEKTYSILAVGDSFTFGDQVHNSETWPSCVERAYGKAVANAGVFGYGAAQSVLRASIEAKKTEFKTIILGILVKDDFNRDQMTFRSGFPHPAVIQTENGAEWQPAPPQNTLGSVYTPKDRTPFLEALLTYSVTFDLAYRKSLVHYLDITGMSRTEKSEKAASISDIVEFTIRKMADLPIPEKVILLQYGSHDLPASRAHKDLMILRNTIRALATESGITVVDTYDALHEKLNSVPRGKLWKPHHTPLGNELVCAEVVSSLRTHRAEARGHSGIVRPSSAAPASAVVD